MQSSAESNIFFETKSKVEKNEECIVTVKTATD